MLRKVGTGIWSVVLQMFSMASLPRIVFMFVWSIIEWRDRRVL